MLYKDNIISLPAIAPSRPGINPNTNFLLKRATSLSSITDEVGNNLVLYKLHNGNFAILTKYANTLRSDSLERVELHSVAEKFNISKFI